MPEQWRRKRYSACKAITGSTPMEHTEHLYLFPIHAVEDQVFFEIRDGPKTNPLKSGIPGVRTAPIRGISATWGERSFRGIDEADRSRRSIGRDVVHVPLEVLPGKTFKDNGQLHDCSGLTFCAFVDTRARSRSNSSGVTFSNRPLSKASSSFASSSSSVACFWSARTSVRSTHSRIRGDTNVGVASLPPFKVLIADFRFVNITRAFKFEQLIHWFVPRWALGSFF